MEAFDFYVLFSYNMRRRRSYIFSFNFNYLDIFDGIVR